MRFDIPAAARALAHREHRRAHGRAVGALLCIAGASTLASVGWGLKDQGLYCVAVMLIALVAARRLASSRAPGVRVPLMLLGAR
ncbi:MAG: hypothetical protein NVS4B6_25770 [Mycobacterium sp.]